MFLLPYLSLPLHTHQGQGHLPQLGPHQSSSTSGPCKSLPSTGLQKHHGHLAWLGVSPGIPSILVLSRGRAMDRERQKANCILLSRKGSGEPGTKAERARLKPLHPPTQPQEAKARRAGQTGHVAEASREPAGSTKGDRTPWAASNSVPTEENSGRKSGH